MISDKSNFYIKKKKRLWWNKWFFVM